MAVNRKVAGIKIPDIFIRNDADDATTGQIVTSKAGTVALALTGSNAGLEISGASPSLNMTGTGGKYYLANSGGTVGTLSLGAGNALIFQIQATTGTLIDV